MLGNGGKGRDVVSMMERGKARRMAPIRAVEAYWHGLCAEDKVPLRAEVDPRGMEAALENAFLIERIAPSMAKMRVAGSHLSDLMGMQIAGMPLSSLIAPGEREKFGKGIEALFSGPSIVRMDLRAEPGFGKPDMDGHLVLLPLRSDFGDLSRGLGALVTQGRIGRTPRRFEVTNMEISAALMPGQTRLPKPKTPKGDAPRRVSSAPLPERPRAGSVEAGDVVQNSGQDTGQNTGQNTGQTGARGHLRLVVSND